MRKALALAIALAIAPSCASRSEPPPCTPHADVVAAYGTVADYCMVSIADGKVVAHDGVVPYDVVNPLFSDYAAKSRTVWLPPGTAMTYRDHGPLELPVGAVLTKSFGLGGKWIETRVLVQTDAGLRPSTYVWDDAQASATLEPAGRIVETGDAHYLVPNQNQCKKCHEDGGRLVPIGLRATEIAPLVAEWTARGILRGAPEAVPKVARWDDAASGTIAERARAYVDANCAHCHREGGEARTSGLYLGLDVADPELLGRCKPPVAAGRAAVVQFDVSPGKPDDSLLIHRVESTEPQVMMPEIGRSVVHREGAELLRAWIAGMDGACQ